jgi:hypothetical protein
MATTLPASLSTTTPARRGLLFNLPLPFTSSPAAASSVAAADARTSAVVRAIAAASAKRHAGVALKTVRTVREKPDEVLPPCDEDDAGYAELEELVHGIAAEYDAPSDSAKVSATDAAHAAAVGADPRLMELAHARMKDERRLTELAARWVASINVDVLALAARSGARRAGIVFMPSKTDHAGQLADDVKSLRKEHDALAARVNELHPSGGGSGKGEAKAEAKAK